MGKTFFLVIVILVILMAWLYRTHPVGGAQAVPALRTGGREALSAPEGSEDAFPYWAAVLPSAREMFQDLKRAKLRQREPRRNTSVLDRQYPDDFMRTDGISNHFSEAVRMQCKFGNDPSPAEVWVSARPKILAQARKLETMKGMTRGVALREAVYGYTRECNVFNPAFGLFLLRALGRKLRTSSLRILDPSAGWGDRAIAACAAGAECYHGYDPNTHLRDAYHRIFENFRPSDAAPRDFWVRSMPFEMAPIDDEFYDVVLTSPPFFDLEVYPGKGGDTGRRLPQYTDWLEHFYVPYLTNAWRGVRKGGFLVLYISDITDAPLATDTLRLVGAFPRAPNHPDVYGFRQITHNVSRKRARIRPAFVWRKR